MEDAHGRAMDLGPKNPFCRFTWDENVGCASCGCWLGRFMRSRDKSLSLEPDRLGFECRLHHAWALEPWGKSHFICLNLSFLTSKMGMKLWF